MQYKFLPVDLKADDEGTISGYGSVFGNTDNGFDIVQAGAFSNSLKSGRKVKMLMQHDPWSPIGVWTEVSEDEKGLRVKGRILTDVQAGKDAYSLVKAGAIDGLSIGYRTLDADKTSDGVRIIKEAELWEVSVVTFPMNEAATIDAVKAAEMSKQEMERMLKRDAKLSASVAKRLIAGGYDALQAKREVGSGIEELADQMRLSLMRHGR